MLENIKYIYENNKQKIVLFGSIVLVMILIIITVSIVARIVGSKITYEQLEEKLESAALQYMNDNPANLPTADNETTVVGASTLVENKYIKELKHYVKDASCTANVNVYYNSGDYEYQAFVTCNNFKTKKLIDVLNSDNQISSFGEGLYELNNELVYRGQDPNNYLLFNDELWRIVKITSDGKILIINNELSSEKYGVWDDRYNTEKNSTKGINSYSLSRALTSINSIYQTKYQKYANLLTTYSVCTGKRNPVDFTKNGNTECATTLDNQNIGLLPLYDYMNASLDSACYSAEDEECQNYNYLVNSKGKWWTVTANNENTYQVYYINYSGKIDDDYANSSAYYRYILALNKNVLYSDGDGTSDNPYEIR
jgi:hypothetical protein